MNNHFHMFLLFAVTIGGTSCDSDVGGLPPKEPDSNRSIWLMEVSSPGNEMVDARLAFIRSFKEHFEEASDWSVTSDPIISTNLSPSEQQAEFDAHNIRLALRVGMFYDDQHITVTTKLIDVSNSRAVWKNVNYGTFATLDATAREIAFAVNAATQDYLP